MDLKLETGASELEGAGWAPAGACGVWLLLDAGLEGGGDTGFVVPELDPLVDTDGDEASEMFSPSDRAMALISSSCSPSLSEGLDFKLEPWAPECAFGLTLLQDACPKDKGDTGFSKR